MPDHESGQSPLRTPSSSDGASSADPTGSAAAVGSPSSSTVLVVGGGDEPTDLDVERWPNAVSVIAADRGVDHAHHRHLAVDLVVGDLDSAGSAALAWAAEGGARIDRHRIDKDQTDLELAMNAALAMGAGRIVITGISGGRLDHLVANLALACSPRYRSTTVDIVSGGDRMFVVRGERCLVTEPGQLVTLVPMLGDVEGVSTSGLDFALADEDLPAGSSRGVSNRARIGRITIDVTSGVLLVIMPGGGSMP